MNQKNSYTMWSWHDAPYSIRLASPLKEQGTWIVMVEPGYTFPTDNAELANISEWEREEKLIDGRRYTYLRDAAHIPWPEFDPVQFDF